MGQAPTPRAEHSTADAQRPEGAQLLDRLRDYFIKYVVVPSVYYDVLAIWVLHAHAIESADTTARLVFRSAEKESGKTRALECLEMVTPSPLFTMNATVPAIFRLLDAEQATLLVDECDSIFTRPGEQHEDLRALLNSGYRKGASVARVVGEGSKMQVKRFPVFAATALASIGHLPDTVESRSIVVPMKRRAPDEAVRSFRRRYVSEETVELREWCEEWAARHRGELAGADPAMPEGVTDRAADCWQALLAIADAAGGDWPARIRAAARTIAAGRVADDQSHGVRLLIDIRMVFDGQDRMPSATLVARLNSIEESPWGGLHGKGLDARGLAHRLKPYGIGPKDLRLPDGAVLKGYHREQFLDAWTRYLRHEEPRRHVPAAAGSATSATRATGIRIHVADVAAVAHTEERARRPEQALDQLVADGILSPAMGGALARFEPTSVRLRPNGHQAELDHELASLEEHR